MTAAELSIAEVLDEKGEVKQRYTRYLASSGERWVRHGLFRAYHAGGQLASEGHYEHGLEHGMWCDYHADGQKAAEGEYVQGREKLGSWRYWSPAGIEQSG